VKKIIQLSKFYKPFSGGIESVVADISEGTCNSYSVSVVAVDPDNNLKVERINGVTVIRSAQLANIASTPLSFGYLIKVVSNVSGNIIHAHYPNPLANLAVFIAWLVGKDISNLIVHWHSDIVKQKTMLKLYKPLLNWSLRRAKRIIVTSPIYLECSEQLKGFEEKCVIVPIGIDSIESLVDKRKIEAVKEKYNNKKIIFSLGRHIYYKGFEHLIESAKYLSEGVILIGGKGEDTQKYMNLINKYNVADRVKLIGRIEDDDLPSYYAAADVFCLPSVEKSEAFGVVQLEAMSVGTPVVSTAIEGSGVSWVNEHGSSGLICQPKNAVSLADSLNLILNDESLRTSLSIGAKNRYCEHFKKEHMVNSVDKIYKDLGEA
jgi:glycosyltransferase involved in cell wall biosynthesis